MSRSNMVKLTKSSQIPVFFPEKAIARDVLPLFSLHVDRFLKEKRSSVKLKANTDGRSGYIIGFCSNQIKFLRALP